MWCENLSPLQCGISMERMLALLLLMMGTPSTCYLIFLLKIAFCVYPNVKQLSCIKYSGLSTFLNSWKSDKGTKNQ